MPVRRRDGGEAGINYKCYKTTTRWYFSGYDFPPKNNWRKKEIRCEFILFIEVFFVLIESNRYIQSIPVHCRGSRSSE